MGVCVIVLKGLLRHVQAKTQPQSFQTKIGSATFPFYLFEPFEAAFRPLIALKLGLFPVVPLSSGITLLRPLTFD